MKKITVKIMIMLLFVVALYSVNWFDNGNRYPDSDYRIPIFKYMSLSGRDSIFMMSEDSLFLYFRNNGFIDSVSLSDSLTAYSIRRNTILSDSVAYLELMIGDSTLAMLDSIRVLRTDSKANTASQINDSLGQDSLVIPNEVVMRDCLHIGSASFLQDYNRELDLFNCYLWLEKALEVDGVTTLNDSVLINEKLYVDNMICAGDTICQENPTTAEKMYMYTVAAAGGTGYGTRTYFENSEILIKSGRLLLGESGSVFDLTGDNLTINEDSVSVLGNLYATGEVKFDSTLVIAGQDSTASPVEGEIFYDGVLHVLKCWNGSEWKQKQLPS